MATDYGSPELNSLLGGGSQSAAPASDKSGALPAPISADYGSPEINTLLGAPKTAAVSSAKGSVPKGGPADYGSPELNTLLGGKAPAPIAPAPKAPAAPGLLTRAEDFIGGLFKHGAPAGPGAPEVTPYKVPDTLGPSINLGVKPDAGVTKSSTLAVPPSKPAPVDKAGADYVSGIQSKVLDSMPFTPAARDIITKHAAVSLGTPDPGSGSQTLIQDPSNPNPSKITIAKGNAGANDQLALSREYFNTIFNRENIAVDAFNKAWDAALKSNDPNAAALKTIDDQFNKPENQQAFNGKTGENVTVGPNAPFYKASERFASAGAQLGLDGISAIPAPLQPFYKKYIDDYESHPTNVAAKNAGGTTISEADPNAQPLNSFQNLLAGIHIGNKSLPTAAINNPVANGIGSIFDDTVNKIATFAGSLVNYGDHPQPTAGKDATGKPVDQFGTPTTSPTPLQRAANGAEAAVGITNLLFAPISIAFKSAESVPVLKYPAKAVDWGFSSIGKVISFATNHAVDALPVSQETKDTIKQPIADVAALVGQIMVGKLAAEKGIPIVKEKLGDIQQMITKDLVDTHIPGKTVYIEPNQVRDILSGRLEAGELKDLYLSLGRTVEEIKTDIKNGVPIEVPAQNITQLVDKPYWAKIKDVFGVKSEPTPVSISQDVPRETVRGLLPGEGDTGATPSTYGSPELDTLLGAEKAAPNESPQIAPGVAPAPEAPTLPNTPPEVPAAPVSATIEPQTEDIPALEKSISETYKSAGKSETLPEFHKADEILSNIATELELSKAGERVFVPAEVAGGSDVRAVPSTFPDWIPPELRSKALFGKVFSGLQTDDIKFPKGPKQRALYNILLDEADRRLGVDTSAIRAKINSSYETSSTNKNQDTIGNNRSAPGSEGRRNGESIAPAAKGGKDISVPSIKSSALPVAAGPDFSKTLDLNKKPSLPKIQKEIPAEKPITEAPKESKAPLSEAKQQAKTPEKLDGNVISKFVGEDLAPALKGTIHGVSTLFKETATLFNPVGKAPREGVDIIMKRKGTVEKEIFRIEQATKAIKKMWDKQPEATRLAFMSKIETGEDIGYMTDAKHQTSLKPIAEMYRERLNNAHKAISQFKDVPFLENFFPHFWEKPEEITEKVIAQMTGRRPLQGTRSFLKARVFNTIEEGIKLGYKPVTTNPEELMQLYEANTKKFVMAQFIKQDMLEKGLWKFVKMGDKAPDNFAKINDGIAKVYYKADKELTEYFDEKVMSGLNDLAKKLDINAKRVLADKDLRGAVGVSYGGKSEIKTLFASPEDVLMHEIGHQIDRKFGLQDKFLNDPVMNKELEKLADTRMEGYEHFTSAKDKAYLRSAPEKMAVMFQAYLHTPDAFKTLAPKTYAAFNLFIKSDPRLRPLVDLKPSLIIGQNKEILSGPIVQTGEHYAQKDVARMINNHLSKDYIMDTAFGRGLMNFKNTLNIFQLGFSAFHLTMETLDSIVSKASIGMSQISQGKILQGLANIALSPTAPVTFFRSGQKFFAGDPALADIEDAIFTAGASFKEKQYYKNNVLDTFKKNVREGNYVGALLRSPIAAVEATMRPLFSYYIPRLKVGAFRDLFAEELKRNASRIADGSKTQEEVAREVWSSVENRMGELNYDNLFWNRNLKAAMMLTFRATGWNLGTVRELGGGGIIQDPFKQIKSEAGRADLKAHGYDFTPKMQYTLSLFALMAAFGAVYQYLHTGKKPESVKDLYYPRNGATTETGDAARVEFPSYLKDLYQSSHNPIQTVSNKLAPELSALMDLLQNKDFYGDYIRNTNDNLPLQMKQVALFLATQLEPFSVQQVQKQQKGQTPAEQQIESFLGIISAPREVVQSAYEKQLQELYQEQRGAQGPRTPEQKAIQQSKTDARDAIKKGDISKLQDLVTKGVVTPKGAAAFIRNAKATSAQRMFQQLSKGRKASLPTTATTTKSK